jgi:hypothetical protein
MMSSPGSVVLLVLALGLTSRRVAGPSLRTGSSCTCCTRGRTPGAATGAEAVDGLVRPCSNWVLFFSARDRNGPPRRSGDKLVSRYQFGRQTFQSYVPCSDQSLPERLIAWRCCRSSRRTGWLGMSCLTCVE